MLKEIRKKMFEQMEQELRKHHSEEDDVFYLHSSEDRIVFSHALFWVMTQNLKGKVAKGEPFLLLRQYQEEMLAAWLTESPDFPELLHYCNILYGLLPYVMPKGNDFSTDKSARRLAATTVVAAGYGGDMPEDLCDDLLDDIDFHYERVKCRKIEQLLPQLNRLVEAELQAMNGYLGS